MPLVAAADWFEILAALIFFLITGLAQWIQKRARDKKGLPPVTEPHPFGDPFGRTPGQAPPPLSHPPPRQPPVEDWETQLRRLLEGTPTAPEPPPVRSPEPPPQPGMGEHDEAAASWETVDAPHRPLANLARADSAARRGERLETETGARMSGAARLASASQAIDHAADLHETIAARMRGALAYTEPHSSGTRPAARPERPTVSLTTMALLRHPATARQAVVASVVLQPPKGLD